MYKYFILCFVLISQHAFGHKHDRSASDSDSDSGSDEVDCGVTDNPRVVSPSGAFKGSWLHTRKGRRFEAYRGIRYAEPPVGKLRFELPVPIKIYKSEVDASKEGPACPTLAAGAEYYYGNFSEDCLRLNVYTPDSKNKSGPLPVIVFIHAGGFYSMSGRSDLAGPEYLLDRDVVLVTINYRLASFGFLSTGDELAPGNNGMKDQVVALRWVQRNIAAFGGNPDLVTITGCSAGSISVVMHMISPMTKGLFHRGIALSGGATTKVSPPRDLRHLAVKQAELLNCPTNSSRAIIDCLRTKTWREIGDSLSGFAEFAYDPVTVWLPHIENDFGQPRYLVEDPAESIRSGRTHTAPVIISMTEKEFLWKAFTILNNETFLNEMNSNWSAIAPISFSLPYDDRLDEATKTLKDYYLKGEDLRRGNADSLEGLGTLYGDAITAFPVHRMANLMCRHSKHSVYYSVFDYVGEHSHYENPVTMRPIGAMHHDDLIYLFGLTYRFPIITPSSPDSDFVDTMTALWYQFAKYGDTTPRGDIPELLTLQWPAMTPEQRQYLRLGRTMSVGSKLFEERFSVWDRLYPIEY